MDWKNQRVLVTGAGGFIGSHLVEALVDKGAKVRAFVRYNSRSDIGLLSLLSPQKQDALEIIAGDLRDYQAVRKACQNIDAIFHLGALIAIPYSYLHPREVVETNVIGTFNVLIAGRETGVGRLIHTSSSEVYGTAQIAPIPESHPLQGQSPYSASKIGADKLAESFYCAYGLPVATIRPFNAYGPRQSARAVIPTIITQALTQDQIHLGALTPRRDFNYVEDLVEGFLSVAESDNTIGEVINVGSNQEISIGELAQKIITLIGRDVKIVTDENRLRPERSEVQRLWADNRKAFRSLNWRPRTSFDEGLRKTIAWISENLAHYRSGEYQF